jgi:hypothetical protein
MKTSVCRFGALLAIALVPTPAAHADPSTLPPNVQFEEDLNMIGLNPTTLHLPTPTLKAEDDLGNAICRHLGNGTDPNESVNVIMTDGHLSQNDTRAVVTFAVTDLCPNVLPRPLPWADPCRGGPAWVDEQGIYHCRS